MRRPSLKLALALCTRLLFWASPFHVTVTAATTLQVGPQKLLKTPSSAATIAKAGDTIEIDAGNYNNDYATWNQDNLTIRGMGGMAHLHSGGLIANGKAIWIVRGNNTVIENIEFSGAKVEDGNGAGIRHEHGQLILRNTFFHQNEFSILTGGDPESTLDIESSRIWYQKRQNVYSHGIYVGALKRFTIRTSHVKGTDQGHQIKSRALENHILYNRIEDVTGINSSRMIDLPNCGRSFVIGNNMHKSEATENFSAIGYGAEGCEGRSDRQRQLYVINNAFVNDAPIGFLVSNYVDAGARVAKNRIIGRGIFLWGKGTESNNVYVPRTLQYSGK